MAALGILAVIGALAIITVSCVLPVFIARRLLRRAT